MKRITIIFTAFAPLLMGFMACKGMVYEDRTFCEAHVLFDVQNDRFFESAEDVCIGTRQFNGGDALPFEQTSIGAMRSMKYHHDVEGHGSWDGFGILGFEGLVRNGYRLVAEPGNGFSPLYVFDFSLKEVVGTVMAPVLFHKEFSLVKVAFTGWNGTVEGMSPFRLQVSGSTCGIDLLNRVPVLGEFNVIPREVEAGVFEFILPRLGDENLMMKVFLKDGAGSISVYPREINLWSYMKILGNVNWNRDDLPDIELDVDITGPVYNIQLSEWEGVNI